MRRLLLMKKVVLACVMTLFSVATFAQQHQVSGVVTDETNQPVPGAAVMIKGTTTGTVTDMDGKYSLQAADGDVLVISFIGYTSQEQTVSGSSLNVNLESESIDLNEVVAVGYGTMKKSDLTGSVSSVRADDLKNRSTTDAAAALQGKAAGVQVLSTSGAPGQGASLRVRGYSSNSGNLGPLLIVDGLKVDNIQYLDPSLIESMEVLKDAASAAIYGAEAGNGVILITTKTGASNHGHSSVSYSMKYTLQSLPDYDFNMNAEQYIDYWTRASETMKGKISEYGSEGIDTNWAEEVFDNSTAQQHIVTFQGGNDNGHFLFNLGYLHNDGIVKGDKDVYNRLTAQMNADYKIFKWLEIGTNTSIEKYSTRSVSQQSGYGSMMSSVMQLDPLTPVYWSSPSEYTSGAKGKWTEFPELMVCGENGLPYATSKYINDNNGNPLLQRDRSTAKNDGFNIRGVIYADLKPVKGLVFTSRLGYRLNMSNSHNYTTPFYINDQASDNASNISAGANTGMNYQWSNYVNYNITLMDVHTISATAGMEFTHDENDNVSASAKFDPKTDSTGAVVSYPQLLKGEGPMFQYLNYVVDDASKTVGNLPGESASLSYFGRLGYTYDNRYSVQGNFRADAFDMSKLPADKRWGYFPSVSAGWTISNESFMQDLIDSNILSFLKLRGSWGVNGNINVLGNYMWRTNMGSNNSWYQYGANGGDNTLSYGSRPAAYSNPDIKWETSHQIDFGLDARFLNDRLSLGLDYFKKETKDLIVDVNLLPELGQEAATKKNAGNIVNKGFEFEIGWKDRIGDFSYSVNTNGAFLNNEVTYLDASLPRIEASKGGTAGTNLHIAKAFEEGESIWYFRGYKYLGVNSDGTAKYENADGEVVNSAALQDGDRMNIGSPLPKFTYGITINAEWKNFDLTIFGSGVAGNKVFDASNRADTPGANRNKYYVENSWSPTNKGASLPDPATCAVDLKFWSSSAVLFNGSYFKIKQIQLGYTVPQQITKKVLISDLRFFVSLDDFFTFTKYPGLDPETATIGSAESTGFDVGSYPITKKVLFGLNLTF